MTEALYLRKELRDHKRSAGPDSWYGRFCEKCLVAWPCYSFRLAEGRERRRRAAEQALADTGDVADVVRAWTAASKATDWLPDDLTHFPPMLLRTGVGHHCGGGFNGRTVSYGLRYGQEEMEW